MHQGLGAELKRIAFFTLICLIFGWLNGYISWTLIIGGGLYMGWVLLQIRQLYLWVTSRRREPPPDTVGIWGEIFDNVYRMQKRHEKERRRLQGMIRRGQQTTAALRDAVVLLDANGCLNWWNQAAETLLGLQPIDQGHPLVNFIRHPGFIAYFDACEYDEPLDLPSPRNESKQLQYQINRFGKGERLVVVRDVTRVHRLEQVRKDFVANVSHELRTPLTVLRGYIETLSMSPDLNPVMTRAFEQMQQQSDRMNLLINDLLMLSNLETDDNERNQQTVQLKPMLDMIAADAMALSDDRQHNLIVKCKSDIALIGSEKELHSAFSNLAFNAVKYSSPDSDIKLSISIDESALTFSVKDQGDGIDPIHIPRLTERFYRVDNGSRNSDAGGTGLGLAIVKHILLRHDAHLSIESKPGKGSTFSCIFPRDRYQILENQTVEAVD
ncbi:phosphate regulon sensor histidine kinase PhoR [Pseudoteredinibacter isoporae]|uniref:Phosphate regulon sensor protein PhoR n=1 Tax=Pseudoteredinibacter isoporae TaxID=570281 RepID=A0A7X0JR83_9GAMM|nr:phosphate regulon sensor histidine kinase PhoR [Pseudoteredinibacter isoporae]MBB6520304.1 two-component system phosphate regulon sensor histidine kinase PhoR [Pseudoteredinibacter isoporae]NHO85875.1 phosphate regulon sensor histidine kinase PhoR [Pseudoteredinibacter isoporae]NIB25673.1 phosphate regulon sensor histidine kinase PhoR [Pseudoteredinibacter isoporae]